MKLSFDNPIGEHKKYIYTQYIDYIDWDIIRFAKIKITGDFNIENLLETYITFRTPAISQSFPIIKLIYTAILTNHKCKLSHDKLSISLPKNTCVEKRYELTKWTDITLVTHQLLNVTIKIKDSTIPSYGGVQINAKKYECTLMGNYEVYTLLGSTHFVGCITRHEIETLTIFDFNQIPVKSRDINVIKKRFGEYYICIAPCIETNIEKFSDLCETIKMTKFVSNYNIFNVSTNIHQMSVVKIECINFDLIK